jgi:hypothetical protein
MAETPVYIAPAVASVRALWDRSGARAEPAIRPQLSGFADAIRAAATAGEDAAEVLAGNWLTAPRWRSDQEGPDAELSPTGALSAQQAQLIAARDHGFPSWSDVDGTCDPIFERAVEAVVGGRIEELGRLLSDAPDLVHRRSAYGHRATLLHYTAANGVEIRRQVVPGNAAQIAARLLDAGADPEARLHAYGATFDTLSLLRSSAHPRHAGVAAELERVLGQAKRARDAYGGRTPTSHERQAGQPWDESYRDGPAPWDIGAPQPAVVRLAGKGAFAGAVLDAGCGTGENALHVASLGLEVLGVDVARTAVSMAQAKAAAQGLTAAFATADALHLDRLGRTFDTVLDCALFHTFDRDERRDYVASLAGVTARGGRLYVLCFSDAGHPDSLGPHPVSEDELRAPFAAAGVWTVSAVSAESLQTRFSPQGVPAWLATMQRI